MYVDDSEENFSEIREEIPETLLEIPEIPLKNLEILVMNLLENHEQISVLGSKKTILDAVFFYVLVLDYFQGWRIHDLQECYVRFDE